MRSALPFHFLALTLCCVAIACSGGGSSGGSSSSSGNASSSSSSSSGSSSSSSSSSSSGSTSGGACFRDPGEACHGNSECCYGHSCVANGFDSRCCNEPGGTCTTDLDCCVMPGRQSTVLQGQCRNGTCAAYPGSPCQSSDQCMGRCSNGACCVGYRGTLPFSMQDSDCCSHTLESIFYCGCGADADCEGATPACNAASATCQTCGNDAHCVGAAGGPHCNTGSADWTCVQCLEDAHCAGSANPYCVNNVCAECRFSSPGDCATSPNGPLCGAGNRCAQCDGFSSGNDACVHSPDGWGCVSGQCGCSSAQECGTSYHGTTCLNSKCGCINDLDCPSNRHCDQATSVCVL